MPHAVCSHRVSNARRLTTPALFLKVWQPHSDSNGEPTILETGALPIELCGYCNDGGQCAIRTRVPAKADQSAFKAAAIGLSANCPLTWCRKLGSNQRRPRFQRGALPTELSRRKTDKGLGILWRPVRESNPRLRPGQGRTLATELTDLQEMVEATGIEPATFCVQGRRSTS